MWYVGLDWADTHHDVVVLDEAGRRVGSQRFAHSPEGLNELKQLLLRIAGSPDHLACIVETTHGLLVAFLLAAGFPVYPVNPKGGEVEGLPVRKSLAEIPPDVKLAWISVYLPPAVGLKTLPEIAKRGCDELWLNPGSESDELVEAAEKQGLNVIQACSIVAIGMSPHQLP